MNNPPANMGAIIKSVRQEMGLSLDKVAMRTGVSKAMLAQIERGESNPTVSTLWKISTGLRITFSRLLETTSTDYHVMPLADTPLVEEDEGRMVLRNVFPFDPMTGIDYFHITLLPECHYESPSHANVYEEYVLVTKGQLLLVIDEKEYLLLAGDSLRFKGDANHAYINPSDEETVFQNIMKYL